MLYDVFIIYLEENKIFSLYQRNKWLKRRYATKCKHTYLIEDNNIDIIATIL